MGQRLFLAINSPFDEERLILFFPFDDLDPDDAGTNWGIATTPAPVVGSPTLHSLPLLPRIRWMRSVGIVDLVPEVDPVGLGTYLGLNLSR